MSKKRTTYRTKYNHNHGYVASRKILDGRYKNDIVVLYDNRDGVQCGEGSGKWVIVNETRSGMLSNTTKSVAFQDLKAIASGISDWEF